MTTETKIAAILEFIADAEEILTDPAVLANYAALGAPIETAISQAKAQIACTLPLGTRVRLKHDVDRFPHCIVRKGQTGTVTTVATEENGGLQGVTLDTRDPDLDEWDNELHWYDGLGVMALDVERI